MIPFTELLERAKGGQSAGTLELHAAAPEDAISWAERAFEKANKDLYESIPDFQANLLIAKQHAIGGTKKRKEMPVITSRDMNGLAGALKSYNVKVKSGKIPITKMKPMQFQIYVDKALTGIIRDGAQKTRQFLTTVTKFIISRDHYIMEGHHRFLQGILFDPTMKVNYFQVDMPKDELLAFLFAYAGRIGNAQNL